MNHAPANKKALIASGGIAGPVTAMALQRAGIDSVVCEAYDESAGLAAGAFLTHRLGREGGSLR
jgi:FAD-dependent urate hydroxylase